MMKIILIVLVVWSFWNSSWPPTVFIIIASIFNLWVYWVQYLDKIEPKSNTWSEKESKILKKYHVYFRFPTISKINSAFTSGVYLFGWILIIPLATSSSWLRMTILIINIMASKFISVKLNPSFFLHEAVERKNKTEFYDDMVTVDGICEKLLNRQSTNKE